MRNKKLMNRLKERYKEIEREDMKEERERKRIANFLMSVEESETLKEAVERADRIWETNKLWRKDNELITQNISERRQL